MIKLFTIRHGSWLFGTQTDTSDIDLKTVYLPDLDDLLMGQSISVIGESRRKPAKPGDTEEEFIALQVFANHYLNNQIYALELANAYYSRVNVEYINPDYAMMLDDFIKDLITNYSNKDVKSIFDYAYSQAHSYSMKGRRLASIRAIIAQLTGRTNAEIDQLTVADMMPELRDNAPAFLIDEERHRVCIANKKYKFNTPARAFLTSLTVLSCTYGARAEQSAGGTDWKAMAHAVRIFGEGIEFLISGRIAFPRHNWHYLKAIRCGKIAESEVADRLDKLLVKLTQELESCWLPSRDEINDQFELSMRNRLRLFYQMSFLCEENEAQDKPCCN